MINLSISTQYKKFIPQGIIEESINASLSFEKVDYKKSEITILIRNDDFLRKYKKKYFGIDETTDVLSFPAGFPSPETGLEYLGDIIISYPQVEFNARSAGKSPNDELKLLLVHGVLHLLGYDHTDSASQKIMWDKQDQILLLLDKK
jgi:probable rRNA maturation factor